MRQYDVVVVGGGPAGLSAGVRCANEGIKTLIIEKDPIDLAKKALVTFQQAIDAWDLKNCVVAKIRGLNFNSVFGGGTGKASKYAGYVIDQHLFNKEMISKVDVTLWDKTKVTNAKKKNGKVILQTEGVKKEKVEAPLVIDATGSFSSVARMLGKKVNLKMGFVGYGVKLQPSNKESLLSYFGLDEETVGFWGGSYRKFHGYMWDCSLYPYQDGSIDICCGETGIFPSLIKNYRLNNEWDYCKNRLEQRWKFLEGFYKEGFSKGKVVKEHWGFIKENMEKEPFDANLLIVGDNTGRVSLTTGEGFQPALIYGKIAGDFAAKAITDGKVDKNYLSQYGSLLDENELTGRDWSKAVNLVLRIGSNYLVAFIISCLGRFAVKFGEDELINLTNTGKVQEKDKFKYGIEIMKHFAKLGFSSSYRKEFMSGEYIRRKYPEAKIWLAPKIKEVFDL
jgi:electron transfer flavoprotein-quinone oxidoreductase